MLKAQIPSSRKEWFDLKGCILIYMVLVCLEYKMISYVLKAQLPSFGREEWFNLGDEGDCQARW